MEKLLCVVIFRECPSRGVVEAFEAASASGVPVVISPYIDMYEKWRMHTVRSWGSDGIKKALANWYEKAEREWMPETLKVLDD